MVGLADEGVCGHGYSPRAERDGDVQLAVAADDGEDGLFAGAVALDAAQEFVGGGDFFAIDGDDRVGLAAVDASALRR